MEEISQPQWYVNACPISTTNLSYSESQKGWSGLTWYKMNWWGSKKKLPTPTRLLTNLKVFTSWIFISNLELLALAISRTKPENLRRNIWPPAAACRNFQSLWQSHNFQWLLWVQRPPRWTWRREIFPCFCRFVSQILVGRSQQEKWWLSSTEWSVMHLRNTRKKGWWTMTHHHKICQPSQPAVMENRRLHDKTHCPSFVCFLLDAYFYLPGKRLVTSQSWHFKWNPFPFGQASAHTIPNPWARFFGVSMVAPEMEHFDSSFPSHDDWFIVHILF